MTDTPALPPLPDLDRLEQIYSYEAASPSVYPANRDRARQLLALVAHVRALREALEIIAGERQCIDNLMSHGDVARAALAASRREGS